MSGFDLAAHVPFLIGGIATGVLAFVPLVLVLIPVLKRECDADMVKGSLMVGASFIVLLAGMLLVRLFARPALLAYVVGELVGLFACWFILAIALVLQKN